MSWGIRKKVNLPGPVYLNISRSGISWGIKIGPWSWNSRHRRHRLDGPGPTYWQSDRRTDGDA